MTIYFTFESVTAGHSDKVCNQIIYKKIVYKVRDRRATMRILTTQGGIYCVSEQSD